jgi:quercetin dioxygenase-like cupin family protein
MWQRIVGAIGLLAVSFAGAADQAAVTPLLSKDLGDVPGKEGIMLTVEYPPGGASQSHRHKADVFVYVLQGHVVMQVIGGEEKTLGPGDTFYEAPSDVHVVSRNASKTEAAKFLVFMLKAKGAPATLPANSP